MRPDREKLGAIAYAAYRTSINSSTDDNLPAWDGTDHETKLAFRDAGEAVACHLANDWTPTSESLPVGPDWVQIVRHIGSERTVVGVGWRKYRSDGSPSGWWETNLGCCRVELITHWKPLPPLPCS